MPHQFKLLDTFTDDLRKVHLSESPAIRAEIELVCVLSARATVLKRPIKEYSRIIDLEDDYERLLEGIRVATEINALRANKKVSELAPEDFVTPIFYNGLKIHNIDLRFALEKNLLPYPNHLFIIRDIDPETTIGQVQCLVKFLETESAPINNIAVVTSAYHLPRVARTIGLDSPQVTCSEGVNNYLGDMNIFLYGIDKPYVRTGIEEDLSCERDAMINYSSGFQGRNAPSISRYASRNTFFNNADFMMEVSFDLQKQASNLDSEKVEKPHSLKLLNF